MGELNNSCPFGFRSTKHFSNIGNAPSTRSSEIANKEIREQLSRFSRFILQHHVDWEPIPYRVFDDIAYTSNAMSPHTPSSLSEIVPIDCNRNAQSLIDLITNENTKLGNKLLTAYSSILGSGFSSRSAATEILKNMDSYVGTPPTEISTSEFNTIKMFQQIQERPSTVETIEAMNNYNYYPIIEQILGIQSGLCQLLKEFRATNPDDFDKNSLAFAEIALVSTSGQIVPSSRFLKVVLHNWLEYIIEAPKGHELEYALTKAQENKAYYQIISLFNMAGNHVYYNGTQKKLCPASSALGEIVEHFINSK